jgi:hypothetical protein
MFDSEHSHSVVEFERAQEVLIEPQWFHLSEYLLAAAALWDRFLCRTRAHKGRSSMHA